MGDRMALPERRGKPTLHGMSAQRRRKPSRLPTAESTHQIAQRVAGCTRGLCRQ